MVHIVGPGVRIGDRLIQRCSLCGELLQDSNKCACSEWEMGKMVRIEKGIATIINDDDSDPNTEQLPSDSCFFKCLES